MKTQVEETRRFEFSLPRFDTLVSVEARADEVVIRTSRDSLSPERKTAFVHELASEGFIPDHYRWSYSANGGLFCHVRWMVDPSWWMPSPEVEAHTHRIMAKVLASSALLWLFMMTILICRGAR